MESIYFTIFTDIPAFRNNIAFLPGPESYAQIHRLSDSLPVLIFHQYKMLHQEYYSETDTVHFYICLNLLPSLLHLHRSQNIQEARMSAQENQDYSFLIEAHVI